MKLAYLEPKADVRLLLAQDIIAASSDLPEPDKPLPDDAVVDPFN